MRMYLASGLHHLRRWGLQKEGEIGGGRNHGQNDGKQRDKRQQHKGKR